MFSAPAVAGSSRRVSDVVLAPTRRSHGPARGALNPMVLRNAGLGIGDPFLSELRPARGSTPTLNEHATETARAAHHVRLRRPAVADVGIIVGQPGRSAATGGAGATRCVSP
jgi:hypothetical protein